MIFSWNITGEAGFGITTIGLTMAKICARHGLHIWDYAEYPSLIRGGYTSFELAISNTEVQTLSTYINILVCLRQDGFDNNKSRLNQNSIIIYDQDEVKIDGDYIKLPIPFKQIRTKHKAYQVTTNVISMGVTMAILGWDLDSFNTLVNEQFKSKGQEVIDYNIILAKEGWESANNFLIQNNDIKSKIENVLKQYEFIGNHPSNQGGNETSLIMTGNEAFSLASIIADCRAYFAYPMSPASNVLSVLAGWAKTSGMLVRHVEDEIAAVSEALGSAYMGVRSSVGTSGGGFALMVESLSYAGIAEIPLVIYIAQRPGPATGLPTWTGQGDLLFTVHAGHGEFPKIVLAPGDMQEMIELSVEAYNLATIYQMPVIVLTDRLLAESHSTVSSQWLHMFQESSKINNGKLVSKTDQNPYLRYRDSDDGISEYLLPGLQDGVHWQANSYEHLENTHTTEDASEVVKQVNKRARKMVKYLETDYKGPKIFGSLEDTEIVFVSYGSNIGSIKQSMIELQQVNKRTAYIHFTHLYPLLSKIICPLFEHKAQYVLVENSGTGQFGKLLRQECGISIDKSILRYDGRPITVQQIVNSIITIK